MTKTIETNLMKFEDLMNPQHVYCRIKDYLKEYGITKKDAREFERIYENQFYAPLMKKVNEFKKKEKEN